MVLRSTGRVKRGLGTIRQDLNVSIIDGTRCEIKGAQDLRMIPTIIENEASRQQALIEIRKELKTIVVSSVIDVTEACANSTVEVISKALKTGKALGIKVDDFSGYFGRELCPNYRLGTELAGIAKAWGFGGIIHSDEPMEKYGLDEKTLSSAFERAENDAFLILIGNERRIRALFSMLIIPRIRQLVDGVPSEVRRANPDGTTSYLRPIASAARMYPETDIPVVTVNTNVEPPKLITEHVAELAKETGLSKDLVGAFIQEGIPITDFKQRFPKLSYEYLSSALLEWPRDITTRLGTNLHDPVAYVEPLLADVASGKLASSSVKAILEEIGEQNKNETFSPANVHELAEKYAMISDAELSRIIDEIVRKQPDAVPKQLMGLVMAKVKGRADGKHIMQLLTARLKG